MAIAIIHRSVTQRRVFKNLLRQANYPNIRYFPGAGECLEAVTPQVLGCSVVQKEILQEEGSRRGQDRDFQALLSSAPMLVVSYQFTQEETVELVRGGADELLLMPFAPEELYAKLSPLVNVTT